MTLYVVALIAIVALISSFVALAVHFNKKWSPQAKPATLAELKLLAKKIGELEAANKGLASFDEVADYLEENYFSVEDLRPKFEAIENDISQSALASELDTLRTAVQNAGSTPLPPLASPGLERKLERVIAVQSDLAAYLRVLYSMSSAQASSSIKEEIETLEAVIAESQKGLVPLQEAVRATERKLADLRRNRMVENPSEEELDREAAAYVSSLKLKTAKERTQATLDYFEMRPDRYQAHVDAIEAAKAELEEAKSALKAFSTESDVGDAETRLAELKARLAIYEDAENTLNALERKVASAASPSPPRPPVPAPAAAPASVPPPPPSVDDPNDPLSLGNLKKMSSMHPPAPPAPPPPAAPAAPTPIRVRRRPAGPPPLPKV